MGHYDSAREAWDEDERIEREAREKQDMLVAVCRGKFDLVVMAARSVEVNTVTIPVKDLAVMLRIIREVGIADERVAAFVKMHGNWK